MKRASVGCAAAVAGAECYNAMEFNSYSDDLSNHPTAPPRDGGMSEGCFIIKKKCQMRLKKVSHGVCYTAPCFYFKVVYILSSFEMKRVFQGSQEVRAT